MTGFRAGALSFTAAQVFARFVDNPAMMTAHDAGVSASPSASIPQRNGERARLTLGLLIVAVLLPLAGPIPGRAAESGPDDAKIRRLYRDSALQLLKEGNQRFAAGKSQHPSLDETRRLSLAKEGQEPVATILTCSDSQVPPELLFDRGLGDLFVVRVAGHVASTDAIASIEYAIGHLHTPIFVVLGHARCGTVTAVAQGAELPGYLPRLAEKIQPAIDRAKAAGGLDIVPQAVLENVWQSVQDSLSRSSTVHAQAKAGAVLVLGAVYDHETGKVEWLGPHPQMQAILSNPVQTEVAAHDLGQPAGSARKASEYPPGVAPPIGPPPVVAAVPPAPPAAPAGSKPIGR